MTEPRRILVATDFSVPARHAVQRAALLTGPCQASLDLLHVLERGALDSLRQLGSHGKEAQTQIRRDATSALQALAQSVELTPGAPASWHLAEGRPAQEIMVRADQVDAMMLMLGGRGARPLHDWLLGGTVERVMRLSRRSVLMVKHAARRDYQNVLVATDFSAWSTAATELAILLAPQSELSLLHVHELPFEGKLRYVGATPDAIEQYRDASRERGFNALQQAAKRSNLSQRKWRPLVLEGDPAERILDQAEELGTDLIVLGKHGLGMVEELLLGTVTRKILSQAHCDVLVAQATVPMPLSGVTQET